MKSPTSGGASRYDVPPVPKNFSKARKLSKDSSITEEHSHDDKLKNLKLSNHNTDHCDVLSSKYESLSDEELFEGNITHESVSQQEFKSVKMSEKKLYQNLD